MRLEKLGSWPSRSSVVGSATDARLYAEQSTPRYDRLGARAPRALGAVVSSQRDGRAHIIRSTRCPLGAATRAVPEI
jgi:hypothetical protein